MALDGHRGGRHLGHDVHFDPCADRERTYAAGDFPVALPHSLRGYLVHFASNIALPHVAFLTENTALEVTLTTNVAFIVCSTPLLTMLLARLFYRSERATWRLVCGSLLALLGVGLVIFNGNFVLKLSPLGDVLSLTAALCWAFYSLIMRQVADRYSTVFITRKVFFYGVLTILPAFLVRPWQFPLEAFARPAVWMNLLFLSVLASLVCFVVWNFILKQLGTVRASNYIYLNPIFTSIGALLFLGEPLTPVALLGAACVLCGVYLAGKK